MGEAPAVQALLDKRAELKQAISELAHEICVAKRNLAQLEQTLRLFAPTVAQVKRQVAAFVWSKCFRPGEISRRCMEAFPEHGDDP